jgi:hypothetical protein
MVAAFRAPCASSCEVRQPTNRTLGARVWLRRSNHVGAGLADDRGGGPFGSGWDRLVLFGDRPDLTVLDGESVNIVDWLRSTVLEDGARPHGIVYRSRPTLAGVHAFDRRCRITADRAVGRGRCEPTRSADPDLRATTGRYGLTAHWTRAASCSVGAGGAVRRSASSGLTIVVRRMSKRGAVAGAEPPPALITGLQGPRGPAVGDPPGSA